MLDLFAGNRKRHVGMQTGWARCLFAGNRKCHVAIGILEFDLQAFQSAIDSGHAGTLSQLASAMNSLNTTVLTFAAQIGSLAPAVPGLAAPFALPAISAIAVTSSGDADPVTVAAFIAAQRAQEDLSLREALAYASSLLLSTATADPNPAVPIATVVTSTMSNNLPDAAAPDTPHLPAMVDEPALTVMQTAPAGKGIPVADTAAAPPTVPVAAENGPVLDQTLASAIAAYHLGDSTFGGVANATTDVGHPAVDQIVAVAPVTLVQPFRSRKWPLAQRCVPMQNPGYIFSVSPNFGCHFIRRFSITPTAPSSSIANAVSTRIPANTVLTSKVPSACRIR